MIIKWSCIYICKLLSDFKNFDFGGGRGIPFIRLQRAKSPLVPYSNQATGTSSLTGWKLSNLFEERLASVLTRAAAAIWKCHLCWLCVLLQRCLDFTWKCMGTGIFSTPYVHRRINNVSRPLSTKIRHTSLRKANWYMSWCWS